jgi:hypothetical protein
MFARLVPRTHSNISSLASRNQASRLFCVKTTEHVTPDSKPENKEAHTTASPEERRPFTFGRFILYATSGISGATFLYYFYQSGFNLHKTEIMISRKLAELPFYWPPGPSNAEINTTMPEIKMPLGLRDQASAWFIYQDTVLKDGVRRNHVLDICAVLGLVDPEKEGDTSFQSVGDGEFRKKIEKIVTNFIEKGRGRLNEYKRQSGVSLQETVFLLDDLISTHIETNPNITETVSDKLNELLGTLVDAQEAQAGVPGMALMGQSTNNEKLPEVEASDADILEMELSQLEKSRDDLKTRGGQLSDAENGRLVDLDAQIVEVRALLKNASK